MRAGAQRCAQPRRSCAITRVGLCLCPMAAVLSAVHTASRDRVHARRACVPVSMGVCVRLRVRVSARACACACGLRVRDAWSVMSSSRPPQLPAHPAADVASRRLRRQPAPRCASQRGVPLPMVGIVRALMRAVSEPAAVAARSALAAEAFSRG
jgi:hypothetical protein